MLNTERISQRKHSTVYALLADKSKAEWPRPGVHILEEELWSYTD